MKKILVMSVAALALTMSESRAGVVDSGTCNNAGTCLWSLDSEGNLNITGNGPMNDFNTSSDVPWKDNMANIKSANLTGVTTIGSFAFHNATSLESVIMPDVERIEDYAFTYCDALTSVDIPNVKKIKSLAFLGHESGGVGTGKLKYVGIPDDAIVDNNAFLYNPSVAQCGNGGSCGGCGDGLIMPGQGCVSSCSAGYADYNGRCWLELPFSKKHWTPAEVNQWLKDDDNTITITFKKQ